MNTFPLMRIQGRKALKLQYVLNNSKFKLDQIWIDNKSKSNAVKKTKIEYRLYKIIRNLMYENKPEIANLVDDILSYIRYKQELDSIEVQDCLMFIEKMNKKMNIL